MDDVLRVRSRLTAARPLIYILIVICSALGTFIYNLRVEGIFSCPANGYTSDQYLAYCQAVGYGDYEHGAFWFGLEPATEQFAANAEVLFLGDSRLQFAFSNAETSDWFLSAAARYYLMGFSYGENVTFIGELLRKFKPQAKVYIVNIDPFLERSKTSPARTVMEDPNARSSYDDKRRWQRVHDPFCKGLPAICGNHYVVFRSYQTGAYRVWGNVLKSTNVSYERVIDDIMFKKYVISGIDFLSHLAIKKDCVIFTMVPTVGTKLETGRAVAAVLGVKFVAPEITDLMTFDGLHLDQPSAEQWTKGFFQIAITRIRQCLGTT